MDPVADYEWSRIPHFYNSFYVYQYATSYAAATALSKKIMAEGPVEVSRYLGFLKSGSSDYPIEVLKKAGVDMNSPAPIEAAIEHFDQVLTEMDKLHDARLPRSAGERRGAPEIVPHRFLRHQTQPGGAQRALGDPHALDVAHPARDPRAAFGGFDAVADVAVEVGCALLRDQLAGPDEVTDTRVP